VHRSLRSFTLLEAIVATFILSAVAIVCLQLRAGSLRDAVAIQQAERRGAAATTLLRLAQENMLPGRTGPEEGDASRRVTWSGEHLGQPFTCRRELVTRRSPLGDPSARGLAQRVLLWEYTLTYDGRAISTLRPVGRR